MFKFPPFIFIFLLAFMSCASKTLIFHSKKGFYEINSHGKKIPIRNIKNELIHSEKKALIELESIKNMTLEIKARAPKKCKNSIQLSKDFHLAKLLLKIKSYDKAKFIIDSVIEKCADITKSSYILYLRAYYYQETSQKELRNQDLTIFLKKSQSVFPDFFNQYENPDEDISLYNQYKVHTLNVLKDSSQEETLRLDLGNRKELQIQRFSKHPGSYLSGFENQTDLNGAFIPYYTNKFGVGFSTFYRFKTKWGYFAPVLKSDSINGLTKAINFTKPTFKERNRRYQTSMVLGIYEWREISYSYDEENSKRGVPTVNKTGFGQKIGYGGTYQISNNNLLTYEFIIRLQQGGILLHNTSLYAYPVGKGVFATAGFIENRPAAGLRIKFFNLYYDLEGAYFAANLVSVFTI